MTSRKLTSPEPSELDKPEEPAEPEKQEKTDKAAALLKYFANDSAPVKLCALFVIRLPYVVAILGMAGVAGRHF